MSEALRAAGLDNPGKTHLRGRAQSLAYSYGCAVELFKAAGRWDIEEGGKNAKSNAFESNYFVNKIAHALVALSYVHVNNMTTEYKLPRCV